MQTEGRLWCSIVAPRLEKILSKDKNTSKRAYNGLFSVLYKTSFGNKESKKKGKSCNEKSNYEADRYTGIPDISCDGKHHGIINPVFT